MRQLTLVIAILSVIAMTSCSEPSITAKLRYTWVSTIDYTRHYDVVTVVRQIPLGINNGEIVRLAGKEYIVDSVYIEDKCPYELGECPNPQCINSDSLFRDYQVEIYMDTVWIYDGHRLVGKYTTNWSSQLDSILLADNQ